MMKYTIAMLACLFCLPAQALQGDIAIAAIVNDDVISTLDLTERVDLAIKTTGQPDSAATRQRMRAQMLQALIDEQLRLSEAERFNILISADDIDTAIARIEQGRGQQPGSLESFIRDNNLSLQSFRNQVRAQIAWQKLVARQMQKEVSISDEEVNRAQQRLSRGKIINEVQIASIVLPIEDAAKQQDTLSLARDIRSQLLSGADAPELLAKYQERIALEFGPMTWVNRDLLNPVIKRALQNANKGDIAEPVRTPAGFQIIRLLDERKTSTVPQENAEVALKQIILKLDEESLEREIDSMMHIARDMAKYPGSCTEQGIAGLQNFQGLDIDVNYIRTTLTNMAPNIRYLVEPLSVTGITEPFAAEDGIHLLMLCEKISLPPPLPNKDDVRQALFDEKIELENEKYLRRLRREAFIDVRV